MTIGVIGSSAGDDEEEALAEDVGARIAERGAILVCGGMGGVMEAACRGARAKGGMTIGILPGSEKGSGNRHLDIVIPTGMGYARNALVVLAADGAIAVGGMFGTLTEIAYCHIYGIPVVGLRTWSLKESRFPAGLSIFTTPAEAAQAIFRKIEEGK
ncbi:MAG: TIGR00725 family protein [Candidatus Glassbacteria bacterium RBG_16_58_8]|uniref:TIGR00725 family protein n=1 Tax=Candidatus Glassbacteria bacterium RBG_16_58_8 TaxID=1817866 RepID=A0A1F5YCF0_9BACT|nr:MAG: TIGR00725 family protein [Candidatus Glassbacteria bacterium RBG_16_58_8]